MEKLNVSVKVKNTGKYKGTETVQLLHKRFGSFCNPPGERTEKLPESRVKNPGEEKKVEFVITEKDLRFWNDKKQFISEPGKFHFVL